MKNIDIQRRLTVKVEFTPEQWDLYIQPENDADYAAVKLNIELERLVNSGMSRSEVERSMHELMRSLAHHGAYDSEPIYFLGCVLDEVYA